MSKKILTTPISAEDIKDLKVGDIIYLSGRMVTCRDVAHRRVIEEGLELPVDVKDKAILHAGPIISEKDENYEKFTLLYFGFTWDFTLNGLNTRQLYMAMEM